MLTNNNDIMFNNGLKHGEDNLKNVDFSIFTNKNDIQSFNLIKNLLHDNWTKIAVFKLLKKEFEKFKELSTYEAIVCLNHSKEDWKSVHQMKSWVNYCQQNRLERIEE